MTDEGGVWLLWRRPAAKKGQLLADRMCARSTATVRKFSDSRKEEVGAARFFRNDKVTVEVILATAAARTAEACAGRHVLLIEDTSEFNYQAKAGRKRHLGQVGNGTDVGLFVHPALAVDAQDGSIFGLAWATIWRRSKSKRPDYRSRPIEEKESHRWITTVQMARERLSDAASISVIADREADIYELFARVPDERTQVIVRARSDRALADGDRRMLEALAAQPQAGRISFEMEARAGRPARTVTAAVKFAAVTIRRPVGGAGKEDPKALPLNLLQVREIDSPSDGETVVWNLLTTHAIGSLADAVRIIDYYRLRWTIEQTFRTAKSQGIDVEASFLADGDALEKLAAATLITATRIMQLVHARGDSGQRHHASRIFVPHELVVLAHVVTRFEGKTVKQKNPHPPQTLAWAAWAIARLGGWKGYQSERPPGPITFCRGLQRFSAILEGFSIASGLPT